MSNETTQVANAPAPAEKPKTMGEQLFEIFCAAIFLGMIGLVFYNAFLRYAFRSSFPPSEEWARFLFIYITYFGGIEAFYRHKHIAVDMFVSMVEGAPRKILDIICCLLCIGMMSILLWGGLLNLELVSDQYSEATRVNLGLVDVSLVIMAAVAVLLFLIDLVKLIRKPASEFKRPAERPIPTE